MEERGMSSMNGDPSEHPNVAWEQLPWKKIEAAVYRMQKRIFQASKRGDTKTVHKVQKLLMKSKEALHMALIQRQPAADLVHHSDRGSEYASTSYQEMLHQHNFQISMSRKCDCYDNSMMESFWGTLKEEGIGQEIFSSREEAKTALFDYIEVFYNRKRRHSSLGYLSPVDFEKHGEKREDSFLTKR